MTLLAQRPLSADHVLGSFDSGTPSLDDRLRCRALRKQASGAARTFAVCDRGPVVAYLTLAASAVAPDAGSARFKRSMPDPTLVVELTRVAFECAQQGCGLGHVRSPGPANGAIHAADAIGVRGLPMHAIADEAMAIEIRLGLDGSPFEARTLMTVGADLKASLSLLHRVSTERGSVAIPLRRARTASRLQCNGTSAKVCNDMTGMKAESGP